MASLRFIFDASVLVKALVPPRRKKKDAIQKEQHRLYQLAKAEMARVISGELEMFIPAIALIEIGSIVRRLTGSASKAHLIIKFVRAHSTGILSTDDLMEEATIFAAATGCRAIDTLYLAAVRKTGTILFTDDRRMHELALQEDITSRLLREK